MTVVVGLLLGCGGDDEGDEATGADPPADDPGGGGAADGLAGRTFLSSAVSEGGQPYGLVEGTQVRVTFHDDGRLTVQAGCNTLGSTPTITADRIDVGGGVEATEMGCDPALHDQDRWLADFFVAGPSYVLDGDTLRLTAGDAEIELTDREVADPDRALEGTPWVLDGIVEGDAVSSVPGGLTVTVTFEGGTVAIDGTGCNGGSGSYTVDDAAGRLTLSALVWTMMACGEPSATVEGALSAVLDGEITYGIEAGTLSLTHPGGRGLTLRAG